ncbi:MAG TPA: nucleoside-diphosphate kinase [Candidatus Brocadiia bacterium]|nr:nucleoside-diphosphate kinase [Planctomycetota bacterium]MBI4007419.1 nucleoside-diphosphate kinase [Planctomycetota bacterium]MDO8093319.1 nucleoside-diphosphate kinase [Candidatus Brocadiales bacterium]
MVDELAYVLITPYSLLKSRTGGIIGRLLSLSDLDLVGARMYAPGDEFIDKYCATIEEQDIKPKWKTALINYINDHFRRVNRFGISNRTILLLFKGPDAVKKLSQDVIGHVSSQLKGDTVRGTFGDFIEHENGTIEYFEPAVLTATDSTTNNKQLALLAEYARSDGGILDNIIKFPEGSRPEITLVILKPDNFKKHSARPGNIIDVFSRGGLYIVAAKIFFMSIAEAEEFYGPVREMFVEKLKPFVAKKLREAFESTFSFTVQEGTVQRIADELKKLNAETEFNAIVRYMTGLDPSRVTNPIEKKKPGTEISLALLYQGVDAVQKIRNILGATDPQKAADATVRSIYGRGLMENAAHASDSIKSAERERKIIGLWSNKEPCEVKEIIEKYLEAGVPV